ncbi:uncharacterized protein LOC109849555 [Asparagus officinalis]|uniref:uncharacterized protein LOC109849555 n=1 Tax=Asparagus officinalis TaxID=4686 RepID=UPI00098DE8BE|nr:uncharacterized protein LOC109849555 [Asparagus officinalis]
MLWISLISITLFLLTKLARLVRIWARGSRIRARIVAGCGSSCDLTAVPAKHGISEPNNTDSLSFGSGSQTCIARKCAVLGISTLFASLSPSYELVPGSKNEVNSTINDQAQPVPSPRSVFVRRNK